MVYHTLEYYLAVKRMNYWFLYYNMDEYQSSVKWKKPEKTKYVLYDSIYVTY